MKRLILLLFGLLVAGRVHASAGLPEAFSPFVERTLTRTDEVIADLLPAYGVAENCVDVKENALDIARTDVRQAIDLSVTLMEQQKDVRERTACERFDLFLLEERMRELHVKMADAANECKLTTLKALGKTYALLFDTYRSAAIDGLDPRAVNDRLRSPFLSLEGDPEAPICPFTTDYAPPSFVRATAETQALLTGDVPPDNEAYVSMGCDELSLVRIVNAEIAPVSLRKEAQLTLYALENARKSAIAIQQQMSIFETSLDALLGIVHSEEEEAGPLPESPPHAVIASCTDDNARPMSALPSDLILRRTTEPFSLYEAVTGLLADFLSFREEEARRTIEPAEDDSFILRFLFERRRFVEEQDRATVFERYEAPILAGGQDSIERIFASLSPLRDATKSFGELASFAPEGEDFPRVQTYTRDFALFLRRSCVWNACNVMLDAVLKRVMNEHCWPFGSRCYLEDKYVEKCYELPPFDGENIDTTCED